MIPKLIHRMWLDKNISNNTTAPNKYHKFIESFNRHNPEFKVEFWNMDRVKRLFDTYPIIRKYKHHWETVPHHIQKCDIARFIILYLFGGLYIDLDFMCFKNLSPLLNRELLLVCEPVEHSEIWHDVIKCRLCNGFIGSIINHPFWLDWLDFIVVSLKRNPNDVMNTTGPINFRRFYEQSNYRNIQLINTCDILPLYNDNGKVYLARDCKYSNSNLVNDGYHKKVGNYVHTKWIEGSGWEFEKPASNNTKFNSKRSVYLSILLGLLFIILIVLVYFCFKNLF